MLAWMSVVGALVVGIVSAHGQAVLEGVVQLPAATTRPPNVRYQTKLAGPIGPAPVPRAVVYVEGDFPATPGTNTATVAQKDYQFAPALVPVQRGTRVEFPNLDEDYHNVLSYSKTKEFDLGRYRKGDKPAALVFEKAGVVEMACEIHEHMAGIILVLDTPHFTTTDAEGHYRLSGLPAGRFTVTAWVNKKTVWSQPVELREGATSRVDFPQP